MLRIAKIAALVSAVVLLNAVTTLLFVQSRGPATAQLAGPCVDGDVNGDAGLDIGDPLFLLQHLFQGGPAPVACAQTTPDDIAAAVDAALARYLPRAGERFFIAHTMIATDTSVDLVVVPLGKLLRITTISLGGGTLLLNGQLFPGAFGLVPDLAYPELVPGDTVTWINDGGTSTSRMAGYWLDYVP